MLPVYSRSGGDRLFFFLLLFNKFGVIFLFIYGFLRKGHWFFFFFVFIRSVVRMLTLVSDSLRLRSVSFPLQNSVHMRILGFRRWVIFELLIYVVFGCGENYGKKGKEKERKEKNFFFNFF